MAALACHILARAMRCRGSPFLARTFCLVCLLVCARAGVLDVAATSLIDNTVNLTLTVTTTSTGAALTPTNEFAVNLTTGGTPYYLHEIDLYATLASGSATVALEATVTLMLGASRTVVTSSAVSLALTGSTSGSAVRLKLCDAFFLSAGTTYWLIVTPSSALAPGIQLLVSGTSAGTGLVMAGCTGARTFTGSSSSWAWTPLAKAPGVRLVGRTTPFNPAVGFDNTNFFGGAQYSTFSSLTTPATVTGFYYAFLFDMQQLNGGVTPWYVRFFTLAISDTKNGNDQRTNPFSVFLSCAYVSPTTGTIIINSTFVASNQFSATYYQ